MGEVTQQLRESRTALADVYRNDGLRRVNTALVGSVIGDGAYAVAVAVYAYTQGGATAVGVLGVVRYVSVALLLPFTSMLADKYDRKRVMVITEMLRVVLIMIAAVVIQFDGPAMAVYGLALVNTLVGTAFRPAQSALMPTLATHPGELTAANVTSSTIESVGFFVGPAIGAFLLAVSNTATVYVFNGLTFLWSGLIVWGLTVPERVIADDTPGSGAPDEDESSHSGSMFAGAGDGYRVIFASRDIRLLVLLYCAQTVVAGASLVFGVAIPLDLLDMGEAGVGLLDAVVGIGGIVGGFLALLLAQRGRLAADFGLGVVFWAAPLLLIAAWPSVGTAIAAMVLIGFGNAIVDVNAFTILQRLVPNAVMGRVFGAVESAIIGGMALGALLMPLLIHTVGLRTGLAIIGIAVSAAVVVGLSGLRRIDRVALAPEGLELLRAVPILGALPDRMLERLARTSTVVHVPVGTAVFCEGDSGDLFYVIEAGSVDVAIAGEHVRSLGAGESFGEIALLREIPRTATVVASTDVVLRSIERERFIAAVTGHGAAAEQAETMAARYLSLS